MRLDPSAAGRTSFALHGRPRAIVLDEEGMHHPGPLHGLDAAFTRYDDIIHLASTQRTLWLGSRRSAYTFARRAFADPDDPERLARALVERVSRLPDGPERLARMQRIDAWARSPRALRATWGAAAICLLAFALQLALGPGLRDASYFNGPLVNDGDLWRVLTANFVHAAPRFPLHLVMNLLGLLVVGGLVERPLGAARTLWVMGASALGAMGASGLAGYWAVVGISGVVFGLAGGLAWLETHAADELPATWRLPRRLLIVLLLVNAALLLLPLIAGAAHVGGFAAGWVATALVGRGGLARRAPPLVLRAAAAAVVALSLLALGTAVERVWTSPDFEAQHSRRLAALAGISPIELNDRAWLVAVDAQATAEQLESALAMAERAVAETGRSEPTILDTLAEVYFRLGHRERSLAVIDEAIALSPDQPYYREQRLRFTGERSAADRPDFVPRQPERAPPPVPPASGEPGPAGLGPSAQGTSSSPSAATTMRPSKWSSTKLVSWMS